ncbi:hypothetical protein RB195_012333 [Necator americanus]|uniref:Uncharacterized protein n=1 Tax=Necator americanus TaxID=51031 RepID=A0ABR1D6P9_NECAM
MQQIPPDSRMREETNFIGFTCAIFDLHYTPCYFGSHPIQKDENDRNEEAQQLQISEILIVARSSRCLLRPCSLH